jgi:alanine racemase
VFSGGAGGGAEAAGIPIVGRALYGLSPFTDECAAELGLTPSMTVRAQVITTKTVGAGEGVSYGYTYRTQRPGTLALVAIGYAHGIDRAASNRCTIWLNGRSYPVAGRVAMDVLVADLGSDTADVGDEAVLFGNPADGHPGVEDWARALGNTPDEVVTAIAPNVVRSCA